MNTNNKNKSKINILPPEIVAQIAAGEVVERPASVVKELIENSIDAGSKAITINIKEAGKALIEVIDNGEGMSRKDALKAFVQHATSKISSLDDLEQVLTLGFRGEALASIAAVSEVELNTNNSQEATKITFVGNQLVPDLSIIEQGTSITAKNLFDRVPARKKFLRSESTELKQITDIILKHAVFHPEIHFVFNHNGRTLYNLPTTNNLQTRIFDIWGKRISEKLHPISFDGPDLKITGYIGHPEIARKDRALQFIALNNRPITSDLISKAVEDAYQSAKPDKLKPVFFMNLMINPRKVDVNVHPRKMEVKFSNTQEIYISVKHASDRAIRSSLQDTVKHYLFEKQPEQSLNEPKIDYIKKIFPKNIQTGPVYKQTEKNIVERSLNFSQALLEPVTNTVAPIHEFRSFQVFSTFIILEKSDELLFLDQHAADERINYERLMKQVMKSAVEKQHLLVPYTLELSNAKIELLQEHIDEFNKIGLEIEIFGRNMIKINTIPAILKELDFTKFIDEILERDLVEFSSDEVLHEVIASLACHGSIRAGRKMHETEIQHMLNQLFKCEKPYSCPHGRPIIWKMTKYEIEKKFKRTGFC